MDPADDYADYGRPVAEAVSTGAVKRGVLTCGTGLGMAFVANRFPHVRAAVAWSPEIAELARRHNDANVLVLPARFVSEERSEEHTSELQSPCNLVCRLLLEKKKKKMKQRLQH